VRTARCAGIAFMRRFQNVALALAVLAGVSSCSSTEQPAQPTAPPIATSIVIGTGTNDVNTGGTAADGSAVAVDAPSPTVPGFPDGSTAPIATAISNGAASSSVLASPTPPTAPRAIGPDGSVIAGVTLPPLSATPSAATPSPVSSGVVNTAPAVSVPSTGVALTLLTYDSFALSKGLLEGFTAATGIQVVVRNGGDAGDMVRSLVATRATPQADVVWGIGSTNLQTAFAGAVLYPYMARTRSDMPPAFIRLVPNNEATPVAFRDVCVNYDKRFLAEQNLRVPTSFEDLVKPEFKGKFVVESPFTSSTGLAFLLATISHFGPTGWQPYWKALKANNVKVANSWAEAYQSNFTAGSPSGLAPGAFPLVVAYGSSPANAVALSANPSANEVPTGVVEATCVRDVEFAAIVIGTRHQAEATQLIEFLSSVPVQEDVPLSMFIHPANSKARLPKSFTDFAVRPATPITLDPKQIEANKPRWIAEWKSLGL
jgi:thiamine transport system substrate-binding protein